MKRILLVALLCTPTSLWATEVHRDPNTIVQVAVINEQLKNTNTVLAEIKDSLNNTNTTLQSLNVAIPTLHHRINTQGEKIQSLETVTSKHTEAIQVLEVEKKRLSGLVDFIGVLLGAAMTAGAVFGFIKRDRIKAYIKAHS